MSINFGARDAAALTPMWLNFSEPPFFFNCKMGYEGLHLRTLRMKQHTKGTWRYLATWVTIDGGSNLLYTVSFEDFPGHPAVKIRLPVQGTQVWPLVWEDPIRLETTKPVCDNYWAYTLGLVSHNKGNCHNEKPVPRNEEQASLDKDRAQQWRPGTARNKEMNKLKSLLWLSLEEN